MSTQTQRWIMSWKCRQKREGTIAIVCFVCGELYGEQAWPGPPRYHDNLFKRRETILPFDKCAARPLLDNPEYGMLEWMRDKCEKKIIIKCDGSFSHFVWRTTELGKSVWSQLVCERASVSLPVMVSASQRKCEASIAHRAKTGLGTHNLCKCDVRDAH